VEADIAVDAALARRLERTARPAAVARPPMHTDIAADAAHARRLERTARPAAVA
jgi:hypothetical protein